MADLEKLKGKIRMLLNLAGNNPSEQEAQAAMLKAQQLMVKYRIEEGDLEDPDKCEVREIATGITCTSTVDPWIAHLCKVVAQNYRCECFMRQRKRSKQKQMVIIGLNDEPEVADAIFKFARSVIYREIDAMRKQGKAKGYGVHALRPFTDSYAVGFIYGMRDKFDQQKEKHPEWALVVCTPQEVTAKISELEVSPMGSKFDFSRDAYAKGHRDGMEFSPESTLHGGSEEPSEGVLALTSEGGAGEAEAS